MQKGLMGSITTYPSIFGHEGAGYIRAIGTSVQDKTLAVGDAVLLSFNTCGACPQCEAKHYGFCHNYTSCNLTSVRVEDGSSPARMASDNSKVNAQFFGQSSFSRMSIVKERSVVKCEYPQDMSLYAPLGCGFQTGAGTILNVLKPGVESSVAIFGMGTVGIAALMATKYLGVKNIIVVDVLDEKLDFAKELGATILINSMKEKDIVAKLLEVTGGEGVNFAVDCTGVAKVVNNMIESLRHCGTAAMVGILPAGSKLDFDALKFLLGNKRLVGAVEGSAYPRDFIPQMIRMHREGHFPLEKLCKTYPAEEIDKAMQDLRTGKVVKPVLKW